MRFLLRTARPDETRALLWSFAYFFCLLAAYYVLRPLRDEMGVAGGVRNLQWLFTATFVTMLAAVPLYGALVARLPRRRFIRRKSTRLNSSHIQKSRMPSSA